MDRRDARWDTDGDVQAQGKRKGQAQEVQDWVLRRGPKALTVPLAGPC